MTMVGDKKWERENEVGFGRGQVRQKEEDAGVSAGLKDSDVHCGARHEGVRRNIRVAVEKSSTMRIRICLIRARVTCQVCTRSSRRRVITVSRVDSDAILCQGSSNVLSK